MGARGRQGGEEIKRIEITEIHAYEKASQERTNLLRDIRVVKESAEAQKQETDLNIKILISQILVHPKSESTVVCDLGKTTELGDPCSWHIAQLR